MAKKVKKIVHGYERLYKFLSHDIWVLDFTELSKVKARFMRYLKVSILTIKGISTDKIGIQAASLSFFSALAAVPLVALLFAVTGGFGIHKWFENVLYSTFTESEERIQMLLTFAENIIKTGQSGIYGAISFAVFLWTIIILMQNIEKSFNGIWKVEKARSFIKRFTYYIGLMILIPFFVLAFLWAAVMFTSSLETYIPDLAFLSGIKEFAVWIIAGLITASTFTALFKYIPNKKVHIAAAINAAIVTAIVFMAVQYLYFETQLFVNRMNTIYGVFAAVPLFLIWINTSWWIILIGAELSHAFQNVDKYKIETDD